MTDFRSPRDTRRESRRIVGKFAGGKLNPVLALPVKGNEGGMLSQSIQMELDPIMGRMLTPITAEFICVFVPVQAMDYLRDPLAPYAGATDAVRAKLLTGAALFGTEPEGEISQRCGITPKSVGGVKRVNGMVRLAHNCAVNYLRQQIHFKTTLLPGTNTAITPALLDKTVLDRFNAVNDPDERAAGSVAMRMPALTLPVTGITRAGAATFSGAASLNGSATGVTMSMGANNVAFDITTTQSNIFAQLNAVSAGSATLQDFYNAKTVEKLLRQMDEITRDNPEFGEDMVLRWAHGLTVDAGTTPFVIAQRKTAFGRDVVAAFDSSGVTNETRRSDFTVDMGFSVPIPRTELGGIVITFAVVKPDETISSQPHPILSDPWGVDNFVAQSLQLDPIRVFFRELDANVVQASETNTAFWTGLNEINRVYTQYGFCRANGPTQFAGQTAVWQYAVPLSTTPNSPIYPDPLPQTPFIRPNDEIVTYSIDSKAVIKTPMIFGPTPVETLAIVDAQTLLT